MTDLGRLCRATFCCLALAALPATDGRAQAAARPGVGLCPTHAGRLDAYVQALCDGEASLRAGDPGAGGDVSLLPPPLPRTDASNELAWAGLAVAHCRAREFDTGRQWAAHFAQARQLWLGELDCAASSDDARGKIGPFVRSRMCTGLLEADYAAIRGKPQSSLAADLRLRLKRIDEAVAAACATPAVAPPPAAATAGKEATKKKDSKKRGSRPIKAPSSG